MINTQPSIMTNREAIIQNYIDGYNQFDIDQMVKDFDINVVFENVQNGETNLVLNGLSEFRQQAETAKAYFSERTQTITAITHFEHTTEVDIQYVATLGMDFPNGLPKGQILQLSGKSIFEFKGNTITKLTDIS